MPEEIKLLRDICGRIIAKPWFTKDRERREDFALYVLGKYRQGLTRSDKLEALCLLAARTHFLGDRSPRKNILEGLNFSGGGG